MKVIGLKLFLAQGRLGYLIFPVVKGKAGNRFDSQQIAAKDVLGSELRLEGLPLLEVLKELNTGGGLPDSVLRGVGCPHELLGRPEGFVSQRHGGVDNILAIAAHNHKSKTW
jgi:hypothetical protein